MIFRVDSPIDQHGGCSPQMQVGTKLGAPKLSDLVLPVTVQLKNTATGQCWGAVYDSVSKHDESQFKAKAD